MEQRTSFTIEQIINDVSDKLSLSLSLFSQSARIFVIEIDLYLCV